MKKLYFVGIVLLVGILLGILNIGYGLAQELQEEIIPDPVIDYETDSFGNVAPSSSIITFEKIGLDVVQDKLLTQEVFDYLIARVEQFENVARRKQNELKIKKEICTIYGE